MSKGNSTVRRQLTIFGVIAFLAVVVVSLNYLEVPRLLGFGQMKATTTLPQTGGLAANARVTFRGVEVGRVKSVDLTPAGAVVAKLELNKDADLPANVESQVHSASVIGEQYLELLPTEDSADGEGTQAVGQLRSGATIPVTKTQATPVDAGTLLTTLDNLIRSVDVNSMRTTVDELSTAFTGSKEPLANLLDGGNALVTDAQSNLAVTKQLINNLGPVLTTQYEVGPQLEQISGSLKNVTGQLKLSDSAVRSLINQTPAAADQIMALTDDLHPLLPQVLANLAATAPVFKMYDAGLRQILVIYPAIIATFQMAGIRGDPPGRTTQYFHVNINDPVGCTKGFKGHLRTPDQSSPAKSLDIGWCKLPQNAQTSVRGTRNMPCPNSSKRAATALECGLDYRAKPTVGLTSYDPQTGRFLGPDGKQYVIQLGKKNTSPGTSPYSSGLLTALSS